MQPSSSATQQLLLAQSLMSQPNSADHNHGQNGPHPGGGGTGPVSNTAHGLIHFAHRQIGKPYVWGSTGMHGFDCSGLIYADLQHLTGHTPPVRTAAGFQQWTHNVSRKGLRPGDLVFMHYPNSRGLGPGTASHVGLYAGHGQMIDAGSGGVQKEGVDWSAFIGGGRIPHL